MKRILSFILMLMMCFSLMGGAAYAELDLSSYEAFKAQAAERAMEKKLGGDADEKEGEADKRSPSEADLCAIGFDGQIKMPHEAYYLDEYEFRYIYDDLVGLNVQVFRNPDDGPYERNMLPRAWHGSEVMLLAKRHNFYCIIYYTNENQVCAGWVPEKYLCESFPGDTYVFGEEKDEKREELSLARPAVEWSDAYLKDTITEYTLVDDSMGPCMSLVLEYQVIGRNEKKAYGGRDVYYYADERWNYGGEFYVEEDLDPVRCCMYFEEPVTVQALAVLPQEMNQQGFDFRLCVPELYY